MVRAMRPGSVVVDLAAETGGNCEVTREGEDVVLDQVTVHGVSNLPSGMPIHASQLYSRNVASLVGLLVKDGSLEIDMGDEIVSGACLTHAGSVVNERARQMLEVTSR